MAISFNAISHKSFSSLQENFVPALTVQQKKVSAVALGIFLGLIALNIVMYYFQSVRKEGSFKYGRFGKFIFGGLLHGQGKKTFRNGAVQEGQFNEGWLHGPGKIIYPNGSIDEGQFKYGWLHQGKRTYPNGLVLSEEGEFVKGKFKKGKIIWTDGVEIFLEGIQEDIWTGKFILPCKTVAEGKFKNGRLMNGPVKITDAQGIIYEGNLNNQDVTGHVTQLDGSTQIGTFHFQGDFLPT